MNSSPNIPPAGLRPQLINDRHSPKTILLVEDDDLLCELTVRVLRKGGYGVLLPSTSSSCKTQLRET